MAILITNYHYILVACSIIAYIMSLFCSVFKIESRGSIQYLPSVIILMFGWYGSIAWFANPIYLISLIFLPKILSVTALVIALFTFTLKKFTDFEVGNDVNILGYSYGMMLWFTAIILNVIKNFV